MKQFFPVLLSALVIVGILDLCAHTESLDAVVPATSGAAHDLGEPARAAAVAVAYAWNTKAAPHLEPKPEAKVDPFFAEKKPETIPAPQAPCDCEAQRFPCRCGTGCPCEPLPKLTPAASPVRVTRAKPKEQPKPKVQPKTCPCSSLCTCGCNAGGDCLCRTLRGTSPISTPRQLPYYPVPTFAPTRPPKPLPSGLGGGRAGGC